VWQIVTVLAAASMRINRAYLPLLLRSALILLCALTAVLLKFAGPFGLEPSLAVLPAMLLLCVAALASLPLPPSVPSVIPPLAETLTAAVIVGSLGENGILFLLYLLIPIFTAGITAGAWPGVACGATAAAVVLAAATADAQTDPEYIDANVAATWVFIFLSVGLVGAWMRRLRDATAPEGEPAYADAHRLLSELHVVARQLSLGLDPQTLATALADDIKVIAPHGSVAVLARSPGGRFVTLVGDDPPDSAEATVQEAWIGARPIRREHDTACVTALPVLMGERVVALVVVTTASAIDDAAVLRAYALIEQSGPRLASAMLFDDVRRLATVDERMRLAREIHDGIAQDLASVGYALDDIRRDSDEEVGQRVVAVREQLRGMVGDLRLSIFDLRAGVDDVVGLGTALSEYAQKVGGQSGLVVHASVDESPRRLPVSVEVELLRIVQEAVTNVRRHARAKNLWLSVTVEPPNAHITVADDGQGLGKGRIDSFGMQGMRERASRIGASLRIAPGENGGTLVEVGLGTGAQLSGTLSGLTLDTQPLRRPALTREDLTDPGGIPLATATAAQGSRADQEVT
jgi:signal transduction histidine kinase